MLLPRLGTVADARCIPQLGAVAVARYCCRGSVLLPRLGTVAVARYCCRGSVLLPRRGTVAVARYCCHGSVLWLSISVVSGYWFGAGISGTATGKMTRYRCSDTVLVPSLGTSLVVWCWHCGSVLLLER